MDRAVLRGIAQQVLPNTEIPERVIVHAQSLLFQSGPLVPLKPAEEPARAFICVILAAERLATKYTLPPPNTKSAPLPPSSYLRIEEKFRVALNGDVPTPKKSPKPKPHISSASPSPSPSKSAAKVSSGTPTNSPVKRGPGRPRKNALEAFKGHIPAAGVTKRRDPPPKPAEVLGICDALNLPTEIAGAIQHASLLYIGLTKDDWGLLLGIIYVVLERAAPDLFGVDEPLFDKISSVASRRSVSASRARLEEWIPWARRIVGGQSWIVKIAVEPEPLPELRGLPGSWGAVGAPNYLPRQ